MLKDQALRKKLAELHISTYGSRQLLEQRHKEWVTIWNANCDSAHPKTRTELLRDLDTWEKTISSAARTPTMYGAQATQPQVKDKNFDGASWATNHDSSFKDLIAKARQTKKQAEQKAHDVSAPEPAPLAQQWNGSEVTRREAGSMDNGGGNRYRNEIYGLDGTAEFALPVTNEGADPAPSSAAADG
jgi:E3 ubiquitin-protein ligase RAD18